MFALFSQLEVDTVQMHEIAFFSTTNDWTSRAVVNDMSTSLGRKTIAARRIHQPTSHGWTTSQHSRGPGAGHERAASRRSSLGRRVAVALLDLACMINEISSSRCSPCEIASRCMMTSI